MMFQKTIQLKIHQVQTFSMKTLLKNEDFKKACSRKTSSNLLFENKLFQGKKKVQTNKAKYLDEAR